MRRLSLLAVIALIAACKSSTGPSTKPSPYLISVASSNHTGGGRVTPYTATLTLLVTDTGTFAPHQGVGVTLQVDAGQITSPLPNITDAAGHTLVTWTIDTADQDIGSVHTLGFCAVPPGKTFCKTSLIGSDVFTTDPF
jgi:hypothetical protein